MDILFEWLALPPVASLKETKEEKKNSTFFSFSDDTDYQSQSLDQVK